ncbi:DUF2225 domain-containing protein [Paenibacillus wulumuqiensis]|uniref:DUF2225 domain-containing protein n=1 Tax=Paenibacillus wulumuqiensis TaxID=1567107 RepID=UPI000619097A|nr:DUF2225 domain-containing protein [Paenibacillus wulumuqiensis]
MDQMGESLELEPLYQITVNCPQCEEDFKTSRVRPSMKRAVRRDSDFCAYYQHENPDYYVVRICPHCGFASTENSVAKLSNEQKQKYMKQIGSRVAKRDMGGKRTGEQALEAYKLALMCAQTVGDRERIVASFLHHIAWLYRYNGEIEQELRFIRYCLESYIRVFELESVSGSDAKLMYLIGELHRRLGEFNDAVKWFSRVINDQHITDSAMIRASREQWVVLREQMLSKNIDLPEEMQQ